MRLEKRLANAELVELKENFIKGEIFAKYYCGECGEYHKVRTKIRDRPQVTCSICSFINIIPYTSKNYYN